MPFNGVFSLVNVISSLITSFLINTLRKVVVNLVFKNLNFSTIQHPVSQHFKQVVKKLFYYFFKKLRI